MKKIIREIISFICLILLIIGVGIRRVDAAKRPDKLSVAIIQIVSHPSMDQITAGIYEELEAQGYVEGENLTVDFHNAEGDLNLLATISDQVLANKPDIIYPLGQSAAQSIQNATSQIPIFFAAVADPEGSGVCTNYDQPEANITGTTEKRPKVEHLELIGQIQPDAKSIGIIYSTKEDVSKKEVDLNEEKLKEMGYEVIVEGVSDTNDIQMVVDSLVGKVDAILIPSDNTIAASIATVLDATDAAGIPTYPAVDAMIREGGLAGYVVDQAEFGREAVRMSMEYLEGKAIKDIPVRFVASDKPFINTEAAKRLNVEISEDILNNSYDVSKE